MWGLHLVKRDVRVAAGNACDIKRFALTGTALAALCLTPPTAALAQCTDTFPYTVTVSPGTPFIGFPKQNDFPLGTGTSLNALISTINTVNTAFLTSSSSFVGAPGDSTPNQQGGGVWARAIGGNVETKSTTNSTIDASKGVGSFPGQGVCNGIVREEYVGAQFGFDIMTRNIGGTGGNIHLGVTAGYITAQSEDRTKELHYTRPANDVGATADFLSPAGSFKSTTEVPFLGFFSTYTNGNFFMDSVVRFDYYDVKLTDPSAGLSDKSLKAWGAAVAGNMGYRIPLPANWFLEPSGGLSLSKTWVDSIDVPGKPTTFFGPPISLNGGTVEVDDVLSILGRASLRVGVNLAGEFMTWQPFATASVFREFAGEAKAHSQVKGPDSISYIANGSPQVFIPPNNNLILNTSTDRIGTYAQFGLGTSLVFGNTGWLSYARVDYKTGDKTEGLGGSAGVRFHW